MTVLIEKVANSQRNVTVRISGHIYAAAEPIELKTEQAKLKLTSALWLIEEKMGFHLSWDKESVLLPMESRNSIRFDQAIPCPANWQGTLWLKPFKVTEPRMSFFIILDFDK